MLTLQRTNLSYIIISASRGFHDAPPPYMAPQSPWYAAPPPAYAPPPSGYYGWVPPTNAFPQAPPANSVFMTDNPPPYPGINGYSGGYANNAGGAVGFVQPHSIPGEVMC